MSYLRQHARLTIFVLLLLVTGIIARPSFGAAFPPPPDTTPEPPKEVVVPPPAEKMRVGIIPATGESTKGALIGIAGKKIRLPPDAYIAHDIVTAECIIGGPPCPETPLFVLARGNSTIGVSRPSGIIYDEKIGEGDKEPFAFLKEALQK